MRSRTRPRVVVMVSVAALASSLGFAGLVIGRPEAKTGPSAEQQIPPPSPQADGPKGEDGDDQRSIRALDGAFVAAYNKGDSKALAALFTEDAEVVEPDGRRYQGRDLVEKSFAETVRGREGGQDHARDRSRSGSCRRRSRRRKADRS